MKSSSSSDAAASVPSIGSQPLGQSVTAGHTATFSVVASGTGVVTYQWTKNGTLISGATQASYTTPATSMSDNGAQFVVAVADASGTTDSAPATLTVTAAPVAPSISAGPSNQTVAAGQTATFSVVASGTAPLSYQWSKNGAAIAGATPSSYTTPAETTSDNGALFAVSVSNSTGSTQQLRRDADGQCRGDGAIDHDSAGEPDGYSG